PVNDYAAGKLMVGPYKGRAPDLPSCLSGVLANPANQVRLNRIPLFTVADYLRDPAHYDAERSWEAGLRELAGPFRDLLGHLVDNVRGTALDRTESVRFSALRDAFLGALDGPGWPDAYARLRAELDASAAAPDQIRSSFPDRQLIDEIDVVPGGSTV